LRTSSGHQIVICDMSREVAAYDKHALESQGGNAHSDGGSLYARNSPSDISKHALQALVVTAAGTGPGPGRSSREQNAFG
jgi:hypothetical protein